MKTSWISGPIRRTKERYKREKVRIAYDIKTTLAPIMGGNTELDIVGQGYGRYVTRSSISTSSIPGQVDYRDITPDEDGVYPEEEE